jgi:plasmid maintenance system antidote protein VapI
MNDYPVRKPAEVWPVGHFIENEMRARGWTRRELVKRLGGSNVDQLAIDLLIDAPQKGVLIGRDLAADIARAFGTSAELWLNLDKAWQDNNGSELPP